MRRSESTKISRLHDRSYNEYPVFSAASVKKWEKFGLIEILLGGIPALASAPSDRRSCRGNEPEGMFMSRLMIVVEFEVKPEHRSAFVELMKGHAQRSRAEDGCQQFDVLVPQEDQSRVFLVEAWRDQAALDVHIKLPAMARLREAWQPWLVSMKATRCIAD
jgi:quinol monooxygenase YgiN